MKRIVILTLTALFAVTAFAQPGGQSGSSTKSSPSGATYSQSSSTNPTTIKGQTYTCTTSDYNVIQVTGGTLNVNNCTLSKTGDTSDSDGSSFYGINSSVYVNGSGAILNMTGGSITSACKGANGGFAYGSGVLNISDVTITNTGNLSRGIHATGGGTINATNLTIKTSGSNSSVVATDRGGGTVTVTKGSYITTGTDCAILYSTGTITANDATGSSSKGEVGVIEGNNSITINNCDFTSGSSTRGLMILQSGSGDATGYNGKITINGGSITMTDSSAPLCEIPTNITGTLTLKDVKLTVPSAVLMKVDYNTRWSTNGGTGNLILESDGTWTVNGTVATDSYAKALNVTVGSGVTWNLSDDTTIKGTLTINSGGTVNKNGHTLTYTTLVNNGTLTDVSAINTINTASESSTGNVYNVQGQLVKKAATDLKGLPAGIYILNGKKFFVR